MTKLFLPSGKNGGLFVILPSIKQHTLHKKERLKKRKVIDALFRSGKVLSQPPLKVLYSFEKCGEENRLQFGAAVSKKHFKKAVDRNRIKRLLRECYRTQKGPLADKLKEKEGLCLKLFVLYTGNERPAYDVLKSKTAGVLLQLEREVTKQP